MDLGEFHHSKYISHHPKTLELTGKCVIINTSTLHRHFRGYNKKYLRTGVGSAVVGCGCVVSDSVASGCVVVGCGCVVVGCGCVVVGSGCVVVGCGCVVVGCGCVVSDSVVSGCVVVGCDCVVVGCVVVSCGSVVVGCGCVVSDSVVSGCVVVSSVVDGFVSVVTGKDQTF